MHWEALNSYYNQPNNLPILTLTFYVFQDLPSN
ncbi:hypothetical protein YPC_2008 [Yersinia pestis biovar Medievalis str. Harbin 35]|nr:hypothetical protein YPC_2008 [Yersinia pestis biovar Medievalis str. Harbin 35]EEO76736.1 hypothetical protein YP516_2036 [Yersinia pestis Nepal516]EEO80579.1 hypothetical protein YPF_2898 [Yersinia pestis biovar Orientalis str. India 195]EEO84315.1 hypothetical protein YPH_0123 [Yersinia pestis biovar Orientalis str. PEXU2]EEO89973.1 hypothetical protein YPS_2847 [Yersinia pestis Pestoides A]